MPLGRSYHLYQAQSIHFCHNDYMMQYQNKLLSILLLVFLGTSVEAQVNKPTAQQSVGSGFATVLTPSGFRGNVPVNYVHTWEPLTPLTNVNDLLIAPHTHVRQTTQFFDGQGRPRQTVQRQGSTTAKDVVAVVHYDHFGREAQQFLPYVDGNNSGSFKIDPFATQKSFYQNSQDASNQPMYGEEQYFYSHTMFEPSPLNRVQESFAPGNSWAGTASLASEIDRRSVKHKYLINPLGDEVRIWTIGTAALTYDAGGDAHTNIPASQFAYDPGLLYKQVTLDEHNKAVVEYKDKEGRVILKKVQIGTTVPADYSGYDGFLCTYYIYDDLGQLRFVLPPKAVDAIKGSWVLSGETDIIQELSFRYEYDERGRMKAKKVPGAGWVYMVYDVRDRLVFTQDANMRGKSQWLATLYDELNRPVMTGMMTFSGQTQATLQTSVNSATSQAPSASGLQLDLNFATPATGTKEALRSITLEPGFENAGDFTAQIISGTGGSDGETTMVEGIAVHKSPLPVGAVFVALTKTYYNDYNWTDKSYTTAYKNLLNAGSNLHAAPMPTAGEQQTHNNRVRGLVTGTRVRVLEDPANLSAGRWLEGVSFYDDKVRVVQSHNENYEGGQEVVTNLYDFTGKVLSAYQIHQNPKAVTTTHLSVRTDYSYDHGGRLLEVHKVINDEESKKVLIAKNSYDALGQLLKKELGRQRAVDGSYTTNPLEQLEYAYTIRGWLKGINRGYARPELPGSSTQSGRYFGMDLSYDWGFDHGQHNGNISGVRWRSKGDGEQRAYGYGYDAANRLLYGDFNQKFGTVWTRQDPNNSSFIIDFRLIMGDGVNAGSAYDANGNILRMQQWGLKGLSSVQLDDLRYSYGPPTRKINKLQSVVDVYNDSQTGLGDFRTSLLYPGGAKVLASIDSYTDYTYDANGNMVKDRNKDLEPLSGGDGIVYNHLNLPWQVRVKKDGSTDKGTITYIYDAAGNKLQKRVVEYAAPGPNNEPQRKVVTTSYVGSYVYEQTNFDGSTGASELQFFGQEEGRVRPTKDANGQVKSYAYDYFIKDHLGNVRMVLTDEIKQQVYPAATLEGDISSSGSAAYIEKAFYAIDPTKVVAKSEASDISDYYNNNGNPPYNNNPNSAVSELSQKLYKLQATSSGGVTGLGITLKVMSGDRINIYGKSYYNQLNSTGTNYNVPVLGVLDGLLGAPGGTAAGKGVSGSSINGIAALANPVQAFLLAPERDDLLETKPKAYINWILLDENFKYVEGGFDPVDGAGGVKSHAILGREMKKNGYVYIYVSNQSPVPVFFDNFQVIHDKGPILEETHYYPFGLTMAGISSKAAGSLENKKTKFQGQEFTDDLGVNYYEFKYRSHDPQIGRFIQVDPLSDEYVHNSTYAFSENKVTSHFELEGLEAVEMNHRDPGLNKVNATKEERKEYAKSQVKPVVEVVKSLGYNQGYAEGEAMLDAHSEGGIMSMAAVGAKNARQDYAMGDGHVGARGIKSSAGKNSSKWSGPIDYSQHLTDPPSVGPTKKFTAAQLKNAKEVNIAQNDGVLRSDLDGSVMNPSQQSKKGVPADMNQVEGDHKTPRNPRNPTQQPGSNSYNNLQLIPKKDNIKKSNN